MRGFRSEVCVCVFLRRDQRDCVTNIPGHAHIRRAVFFLLIIRGAAQVHRLSIRTAGAHHRPRQRNYRECCAQRAC